MSFEVIDQLENLTPVWKCVEIEFPYVFYLNNLERLSFVIYLHTKDLLRSPRHHCAIFGQIYQRVNNLPAISRKEKENKSNRRNLEGRCFISTITKHSVINIFLKPSVLKRKIEKRSHPTRYNRYRFFVFNSITNFVGYLIPKQTW